MFPGELGCSFALGGCIREGETAVSGVYRVFKFVRILRLVKLLRLFRITRVVHRLQDYFMSLMRYVPLFRQVPVPHVPRLPPPPPPPALPNLNKHQRPGFTTQVSRKERHWTPVYYTVATQPSWNTPYDMRNTKGFGLHMGTQLFGALHIGCSLSFLTILNAPPCLPCLAQGLPVASRNVTF